MKKFMVMLMAVAGMLFLTGCSDSPKDVVGKWANAIADGDTETANKYSTSNVHVLNAIMISAIKDKKEGSEEFVASMKKLDSAKEEITGDTAKVTLEDGESIDLKKVDGDWKVDVKK